MPNNQKKLVLNCQNKSKNIFERKKWNIPITSTFGQIKTYIVPRRNSKVCKFRRYASSLHF